MRLFADRRVNAILCVRGGYGAARLLPLLDYRIIRDNAKIFVGYSDIVAALRVFDEGELDFISRANAEFDTMHRIYRRSRFRVSATLTSLPVRRREWPKDG
jgi:hypothetical protein